MNAGDDKRFDGLFGERRASFPKGRASGRIGHAPMAGLFGTRVKALKQGYRKSPASMPEPEAPPEIDPEDK